MQRVFTEFHRGFSKSNSAVLCGFSSVFSVFEFFNTAYAESFHRVTLSFFSSGFRAVSLFLMSVRVIFYQLKYEIEVKNLVHLFLDEAHFAKSF